MKSRSTSWRDTYYVSTIGIHSS